MITNSLKYRVALVVFVLQVAQAVVSLGKTLGLSIIGEGGEQPHHVDALREWGCNEDKDFCMPMPLLQTSFICWHRSGGNYEGRDSAGQFCISNGGWAGGGPDRPGHSGAAGG